MKADMLYKRLESDFVKNGMWDEWAIYMSELEEFLSPNFIERSIGVVCDFAENINKVYTAVFPSESVMEQILAENTTDAMLFVHHAAIWDIRKPSAFYNMDKELLEKLKKNRVSIFCFHVPLDNYSEYGTTKSLADALNIEFEKTFAPYRSAMAGVIGKTQCKTTEELNELYTKIVGHQTKLYTYGDNEIKDGRVALVAGGGNDISIVPELLEHDVKTYITGITLVSEYSANVHDFEKENHINVMGGTHYSTESFACKNMRKYFEKLGLPSVFIEDSPILEDM